MNLQLINVNLLLTKIPNPVAWVDFMPTNIVEVDSTLYRERLDNKKIFETDPRSTPSKVSNG